MILSRFKLLNYDDYYANMRISKWHLLKELDSLKRSRQQREELNQAHPVDKKERCKFFVRSGELMERPMNVTADNNLAFSFTNQFLTS